MEELRQQYEIDQQEERTQKQRLNSYHNTMHSLLVHVVYTQSIHMYIHCSSLNHACIDTFACVYSVCVYFLYIVDNVHMCAYVIVQYQ